MTLLKFPNRLREREHYPPAKDFIDDVTTSNLLTLVATSPALFNRPPDWDKHTQVCGFLSLPEPTTAWEMPPGLKAFFSGKPPPIYMTFGSITPLVKDKALKLFVDAVGHCGYRAIIQGNLDEEDARLTNEDIYVLESAPHQFVFPHCALIVHHGGAGTSHSASLCGCPSIVIEIFGDQTFNAGLLKAAGLSNNLLHFRTVTPERLASEIKQVLTDPALKRAAIAVRESMQRENGVARAVELIEACLPR